MYYGIKYIHKFTYKSSVSEELAAKSIRDEIVWSFYASLDQHLGYFILVA